MAQILANGVDYAPRRFGAVRIPGYRCVRRLAGGSTAQLYLAESEKAGAMMVIKVTPSVHDDSGVDRSFERFLQEYEIAHRLQIGLVCGARHLFDRFQPERPPILVKRRDELIGVRPQVHPGAPGAEDRAVVDEAAYGYVDDRTPELAIAVDPGRSGQGIGGAMLARLLSEAERRFAAVSLSVRADNDARRLYERFGFRPVDGREVENRVGGTSITMVRRFRPDPPTRPRRGWG